MNEKETFDYLEAKMKKDPSLRTGTIYEEGKKVSLLTPLGRLTFVHTAKPKKYNDADPDDKARFSVTLIWNGSDKKKPGYIDSSVMLGSFQKFCKESKILPFVKNPFAEKSPFRQGKRVSLEGVEYEEFEEHTFSAAAYKGVLQKPYGVVCYGPGGDKDIITPDKVIAGWYGRMNIEIYKTGKGVPVALGLVSVQVVAKGEPLLTSQQSMPTIAAVDDDEDLFADETDEDLFGE